MKKAIYAGSFDPLTLGHQWVIKEASNLFDSVLVVIAVNPNKDGYFTLDQKESMITSFTKTLPNVSIQIVTNELIANFAKRNKITHLIRGIRNQQDMEYETTVEKVNKSINPDLVTVYFRSPDHLSTTSSSLVKSLVGYLGWQKEVAKYVNSGVVSNFLYNMHHSFLKQEWNKYDANSNWFDKLMQLHSDSNRYYHNTTHLKNILDTLNKFKNDYLISEIDQKILIYATFFHDAIYQSKEKDNEEKSAQLWIEFCNEVSMDTEIKDKVFETISATKDHTKKPKHLISEIFLDFDLAILGSPIEVFEEYEENIRLEYSWVPEEDFLTHRHKIMTGFISPYKTKWAIDQFNENSNNNLKKYKG